MVWRNVWCGNGKVESGPVKLSNGIVKYGRVQQLQCGVWWRDGSIEWRNVWVESGEVVWSGGTVR